MPIPNKNTAVLVFIRSEKEEATIKKFGSCLSFKGNYQVASLLNQRVKSIAKKSGLPVVVVSGNQQNGDTFGQRFTEAVAGVFEKGFDNVIAIGNDCLAVSPQLLRKAATQLTHQKTVIGPTQDGGVYLVGFQKSAFSKTIFSALPWQTNQLFSALSTYFQKSAFCHLHLFKTAIDADDWQSFQAALIRFSNHFSLKNILQNLLQLTLVKRISTILFLPHLFLKNNLTQRGPPTNFSF